MASLAPTGSDGSQRYGGEDLPGRERENEGTHGAGVARGLMAGLVLFALLLPALVMQRRFTGPVEGQYSENATAEE